MKKRHNAVNALSLSLCKPFPHKNPQAILARYLFISFSISPLKASPGHPA